MLDFWSFIDAGRRPVMQFWRRGRDSNPRYGCPYAAFRVRCIQPLCHLSKPLILLFFSNGHPAAEWPFATLLLPNFLGSSLVYRCAEGFVNACRGIFLHSGEHVRIQVQGNADLGMTKPFAR